MSKKIQMTPWEKVQHARSADRLTTLDYINGIFTNFIELKGDRYFGNDTSMITGIAMLRDIPVTIIGQEKGKTTQEKLLHNFGMSKPEGYRKSLRIMKQAEKFNRPIICFIDTPGAYPGIGAEQRGQAEAIARNLQETFELAVPIIAVVIGEGGSGGALALGIADKIAMLEHAVFSILSPEGFASILWKDGSKAQEAAAMMKLTAQDLLSFDIIDDIISEPLIKERQDKEKILLYVQHFLLKEIAVLSQKETNDLLQERYDKYRKIGAEIGEK